MFFSLQAEISNKVLTVLEATPLIVKPRETPIDFERQDSLLQKLPPPIAPINNTENKTNIIVNVENAFNDLEGNFYQQNLKQQTVNLLDDVKGKLQLDITNPCLPTPEKEMKTSSSTEFFNTTGDKNLDPFTPDDGNSNFLGLSNVNYDIDFSDLSGENSIADDLTPERRKSPSFTPDPFSPVGTSCNIMQSPLVPSTAPVAQSTSLGEQKKLPVEFILPFLEDESNVVVEESNSILDKNLDTPATRLPPPLKPNTQYLGFSKQGFQIPSIPCNTGDFSSLNLIESQSNSTIECASLPWNSATIFNEASFSMQSTNSSNLGISSNIQSSSSHIQSTSMQSSNEAAFNPSPFSPSKEYQKKESTSKSEESTPNKSGDKVVKVLSNVLETFDKLF